MDSLTQITLGAAVGEAVLGKKIGNRAMVWGAIAGTIPDLDVIGNFFMHPIDALAFHRGITHSLFFSVLVAPIFGWLIFQFYNQKIYQQKSYKLTLVGLLTIIYISIFGGLTYLFLAQAGQINWWVLAAALLIGFLLSRRLQRYWKATPSPIPANVTLMNWSWLFFWGFLTHILLDAFTPFGTQLFAPFSSHRVSFDSIAVVDPLYTVPFLLCLILASYHHRTHRRRQFLNYLGLGLSSAYLIFTLFNQHRMNNNFKQLLAARNIEYQQAVVSPTIFNNVLWQCLAETKNGYLFTNYSIFDKNLDKLEFIKIPKNHHLLDAYKENRHVQTLIWFSRGFHNVEQIGKNHLKYNDLRVAVIPGVEGKKHDYVMKWHVKPSPSGLYIAADNTNQAEENIGKAIKQLWNRMKGI